MAGHRPHQDSLGLRCTCYRPDVKVVCPRCGYSVKGRRAMICEEHKNTIYLSDIRQCPRCDLGVDALREQPLSEDELPGEESDEEEDSAPVQTLSGLKKLIEKNAVYNSSVEASVKRQEWLFGPGSIDRSKAKEEERRPPLTKWESDEEDDSAPVQTLSGLKKLIEKNAVYNSSVEASVKRQEWLFGPGSIDRSKAKEEERRPPLTKWKGKKDKNGVPKKSVNDPSDPLNGSTVQSLSSQRSRKVSERPATPARIDVSKGSSRATIDEEDLLQPSSRILKFQKDKNSVPQKSVNDPSDTRNGSTVQSLSSQRSRKVSERPATPARIDVSKGSSRATIDEGDLLQPSSRILEVTQDGNSDSLPELCDVMSRVSLKRTLSPLKPSSIPSFSEWGLHSPAIDMQELHRPHSTRFSAEEETARPERSGRGRGGRLGLSIHNFAGEGDILRPERSGRGRGRLRELPNQDFAGEGDILRPERSGRGRGRLRELPNQDFSAELDSARPERSGPGCGGCLALTIHIFPGNPGMMHAPGLLVAPGWDYARTVAPSWDCRPFISDGQIRGRGRLPEEPCNAHPVNPGMMHAPGSLVGPGWDYARTVAPSRGHGSVISDGQNRGRGRLPEELFNAHPGNPGMMHAPGSLVGPGWDYARTVAPSRGHGSVISDGQNRGRGRLPEELFNAQAEGMTMRNAQTGSSGKSLGDHSKRLQ